MKVLAKNGGGTAWAWLEGTSQEAVAGQYRFIYVAFSTGTLCKAPGGAATVPSPEEP